MSSKKKKEEFNFAGVKKKNTSTNKDKDNTKDTANNEKKEGIVYGRKSHVSDKEDRARITITLSKDTLKLMDKSLLLNDGIIESLGNFSNRSHLIESSLIEYIEKHSSKE